MSPGAQLLEHYERHISSGGARMARLMASPLIQRAEGNYLFSDSGERFLSCGGFSVFLFGHQHPEIGTLPTVVARTVDPQEEAFVLVLQLVPVQRRAPEPHGIRPVAENADPGLSRLC